MILSLRWVFIIPRLYAVLTRPQGELDEILGRVPTYNTSLTPESEYFPNLSNDANHPYHLVVM
jgi:hypothetical protein